MPPKRKSTSAATAITSKKAKTGTRKNASTAEKDVPEAGQIVDTADIVSATAAKSTAETSTATAQVSAVKRAAVTETPEAPPVTASKAKTSEPTAKAKARAPAKLAAVVEPAISYPARFTGKFDLYSTKLPFLQSEYLPEDAKTPQFKAVFKKILFYQAKPDFSLRIALHSTNESDEEDSDVADTEDMIKSAAKTGMFACSQVCNPMSDEPLEPIDITGGVAGKKVSFGSTEAAHASTIGSGPGFSAKLELDTDGAGCGMIDSGSGKFKMRKVWEGVIADEAEGSGESKIRQSIDGKVELFEGYWTFSARYGPTLRRKQFGSGDSYSGAFWAVRALKDAKTGEEIGI